MIDDPIIGLLLDHLTDTVNFWNLEDYQPSTCGHVLIIRMLDGYMFSVGILSSETSRN
jgi:hypothetical protein